MSIDDILKAFGGIFYLIYHGVANISQSNYVAIGLILFLSLVRSLLSVKSRLVKVNIFAHGYALCRNKQL